VSRVPPARPGPAVLPDLPAPVALPERPEPAERGARTRGARRTPPPSGLRRQGSGQHREASTSSWSRLVAPSSSWRPGAPDTPRDDDQPDVGEGRPGRGTVPRRAARSAPTTSLRRPGTVSARAAAGCAAAFGGVGVGLLLIGVHAPETTPPSAPAAAVSVPTSGGPASPGDPGTGGPVAPAPVRLEIPRIGVDTAVVPVGLNADGT